MSDGGRDRGLRARRRTGTRSRLHLPGRRRQRPPHARLPRSAARYPSGFRGHGAQRPAHRCACGARHDAHRAQHPRYEGADHGPGGPVGGLGRPARRRGARHHPPPPCPAPRAFYAAPALVGSGASVHREEGARRHRAQGAAGPLSRALRHRRPLAVVRCEGSRGLRRRGGIHSAAVPHADLAQPRARVLPAGRAQIAADRRLAHAAAGTCDRRRRDGR